jgi:ESCRT-II complex subunit VPS36
VYHLPQENADFLPGDFDGKVTSSCTLPASYQDIVSAFDAVQVGLPLRLRKFNSGVIVVQSADFTDEAVAKRIEKLVTSEGASGDGALGPGVGPAEVSVALGLPVALAREALLMAEMQGVLCRDDGPEGLRFYWNFFKYVQPVEAV